MYLSFRILKMTTTQKRKLAEAELDERFGGKNKRLPFIDGRVNTRICCNTDKSINTDKYFYPLK